MRRWEFTGRFEGNALVYHGEFEFNGKHLKYRYETRPVTGGGFAITEYASVDGAREQRSLRGTAKPH